MKNGQKIAIPLMIFAHYFVSNEANMIHAQNYRGKFFQAYLRQLSKGDFLNGKAREIIQDILAYGFNKLKEGDKFIFERDVIYNLAIIRKKNDLIDWDKMLKEL